VAASIALNLILLFLLLASRPHQTGAAAKELPAVGAHIAKAHRAASHRILISLDIATLAQRLL